MYGAEEGECTFFHFGGGVDVNCCIIVDGVMVWLFWAMVLSGSGGIGKRGGIGFTILVWWWY